MKGGDIRMGETRISERTGKPYPAQRSTFRFTSVNKAALEMLEIAYKGKLEKWEGHDGQWELKSEASQISCIIDTELSIDENFTLYDGKTRTHLCDGCQCDYIELKRDPKDSKKILTCTEIGLVPCRCDPKGLGEELPDKERRCDLVTTLRVILPSTEDVVLWRFQSRGLIFNREINGAIDTLRNLGMRRGYCHLSIHLEEKHRGNEVSKFGVARLTLDPNPPNFVARILANTPEAQARKMLEGARFPNPEQQELPAPPSGPKMLPPGQATAASPNGNGSARVTPTNPIDFAKKWLAKDLGLTPVELADFIAYCAGSSRDLVIAVDRAKALGVHNKDELYEACETDALKRTQAPTDPPKAPAAEESSPFGADGAGQQGMI